MDNRKSAGSATLVLFIFIAFSQCNLVHKKYECSVPAIKDTTLYFQTRFEYTFDTIPGADMVGDTYIDTVARITVLYKALDSCYYVKNIKIGMRDNDWGFVNITSTNIARIEPVCTDSGMQFFQTRKLISNEMMTTLDTSRRRIPGKIVDGKLQLGGIFYSDTSPVIADSRVELLGIFKFEVNIDTLYKRLY